MNRFSFTILFDGRLCKEDYSGGVLALTTEQYKKVNGHSNVFWGWGAEDDDMSNRYELIVSI